MPGILTLIGSGETAPHMVKVHQSLIQSSTGSPQAVFLDTPAAFEAGLSTIHERFQRYFALHVGSPLHVISEAEGELNPAAIAHNLVHIHKGTYFVAGPGSASYAIHRWKNSLLFKAVTERWYQGAALTIASAAAIAVSQHALPVYEIYKVGQDPHWIPGLDLLGAFGYNLCIVPHWDNQEGGTHDTRACFLGMPRFARLRGMLPVECVVLGIDEHTACSIDSSSQSAHVRGKGSVTILRGEQETIIRAGDSFGLHQLSTSLTAPPQRQANTHARSEGAESSPLRQAIAAIEEGKISQGLRSAAAHCQEDAATILHLAAEAIDARQPQREEISPTIDLLLTIRTNLRNTRQWDMADQVRTHLSAMGIEIQDTADGVRWIIAKD